MTYWHNIYINNPYQDDHGKNIQQPDDGRSRDNSGCGCCGDTDHNCNIGEMFEEEEKAQRKNNIVTE